MTRPLALLFAVLLLLAPTSAAPVPKGKKKAPDVTGTVWTCDESEAKLGVIEYTFGGGGKLTWRYNGTAYTAGSWAQDGDALTWEVNQKYVEYTTAYDGTAFVGGALNKPGLKWAITLTAREGK